MRPAERCGAYLRILLQICNASMAAHLPDIWRTVAHGKKYRERSAIEAACRRTTKSLRFCPLHIPHAVAVIVMALAFQTKDPDVVEYKLNIFFFPDLYPSAGSEAALLTRKWYAILGAVP